MVRDGYKNTEVGVIPVDWEVKEVGEVASIETGNTPPTQDKSNYGTEYLFVSPADLNGSKIILSTKTMLSTKGFSKARKFPKNSTLFTCIGSTIGKTGLASTELTSNQQINAVLPTDEVDSDYMYYVLNHVAPSVKELAGNQAVPIVNKTQFGTTLIPLPPTQAEQTAIATALSDTDLLLSALDALIGKKEAFKRGMMERLLGGERRLEGFTSSWREVAIGSAATISKESINPTQYPDSTFLHYSIPNFDVGVGAVLEKGDTIDSQKFVVRDGHLLFSKLNPRKPRVWRVQCGEEIIAISSTEFVVLNVNEVDANFLYYALQSSKVMERAADEAVGTTKSHQRISPSRLLELTIDLPTSLPEQRAIARVLSDLDAELAGLRARRAKLGLVKGGMMEVLLGGEVRLV